MKITLSDGRALAYAEYGDPRGTPVFFFHGTPGSRRFHPPDEITKKSGVRLICTDRPGYGQFDLPARSPHPRLGGGHRPTCGLCWTLINSPSAVTPAADRTRLPAPSPCQGRVTSAATISGAGPIDAPGATAGMTPLNRLGFRFRAVPSLVCWACPHLADVPRTCRRSRQSHGPGDRSSSTR